MKKPEMPILVTKPYLPPKEEFDQYVEQIWKNNWLTNQGPLHEKFKNALKQQIKADNITLTVNGHLALEIAIRGLQLSGEIITTPFTFASTIHAITLNGITPVFCDIKDTDLTIDESKIESLITDKTTAILPVHVYGHTCNTERIEEIGKKYNLKVIYDAAHAFGVLKNGKSLSLCGDVSMYSFHATKLFHSIEGGALVYNDNSLVQIFDDYKNFGIHDEEHVDYVGGNAKMNEFQAAMGLANLAHIDEIICERKAITLHYRQRLYGVKGIRFFEPEQTKGVEYNYAYMPVLINAEQFGISRDELYDVLKREDNIVTRKYFYPIATEYACYSNLRNRSNTPVALNVSQKVLALPIYSGLSLQEVDYICDCILKKQK
ncbi:MAG: DegT/DnrJ/EryC1/StrS family aminotransferase [Oscillospiraceae bacterium]